MPENPNPNGPADTGAKDADPAVQVVDPNKDPSAEPDKDADKGDEGEDQLGEAGKKAIKAERDARKAAEKERDALKAEADRLRRSNAAVKGVDVDAIKSEIRTEFQTQLAETAIKAEAKGRLQDPADALLFIKAADVDTSDEAALKKAVDDLLAARPYLAVAGDGAKPWGDVGGGKTTPAEPEPSTPEERMRRAYGKASK